MANSKALGNVFKLRHFVNVQDPAYGAKGDGTTDDTTAIQSAVDSLGTGGGIVFFPKPSSGYLLTTSINLSGLTNITFEGDGGIDVNGGNTTKLVADSSMTGPMFTCSTATRSGAFTFRRLHFYANQLNVDAFYIHGTSQQARFLAWEECGFEGLRTGAWIGDYTNTAELTYVLGANFYRCWFRDCVRPIVADASGFDGLNLRQVWISDPNARVTKAISVLQAGTNLTAENLWISLGDTATHALYFSVPSQCHIKDFAIEANDITASYIGLYQASGSADGGVKLENGRFNTQAAGYVAIDVSNTKGMILDNIKAVGNINVGASTKVYTRDVIFSGSFTYTGTTANVFENGTATGTFTPTVNFATPGDVSISYSVQRGLYQKQGDEVTAHVELTCVPTFTTASGSFLVTNLPFTSVATYQQSAGVALYSGITDAARGAAGVLTNPGSQQAYVYLSGSGVAQANATAAKIASGGTVSLYFTLRYKATS